MSQVEDGLAVVKELWSLQRKVEVDRWDLCSELIGLQACRGERDVELQHFGGKQFAAVKTSECVVTKFLVLLCVWGNVAFQHWVSDGVSDVE